MDSAAPATSAAPTAPVACNKKQTKGRQKIEMKKIVNEDDRLITFSKRRSGIYKKASELATLCGAEVGVVVFSPAGKPFSFAHPCIETIANKFLSDNKNKNKNKGNNDDNNNDDDNSSSNNNNNNNTAHPLVEAHRRVRINELNQHHNQLLNQLDAEKEKGKALEKLKKVRGNGRGWWETPTEELGIEELQEVDASLGEIYSNVCHQLKQRGVIGCCSYNNYNNNINNSSMGFTINDQLGEETIPFNILAGNVPSPLFPPPPPPYLPPYPHFDYGEQQQHHHPHPHPHP